MSKEKRKILQTRDYIAKRFSGQSSSLDNTETLLFSKLFNIAISFETLMEVGKYIRLQKL